MWNAAMSIDHRDHAPPPPRTSAPWTIAVGLLSGVFGFELAGAATRGWYLWSAVARESTPAVSADHLSSVLPTVAIGVLLVGVVASRRFWGGAA